MSPGALFVLGIGVLMLFGMHAWATDSFDRLGNQSVDEQQRSVDCTTVQIDFIDSSVDENGSKVFVQPNQDLEALMVIFYGSGDERTTQVIPNVGSNSVVSANSSITDLQGMEARAQSCDRSFTSG